MFLFYIFVNVSQTQLIVKQNVIVGQFVKLKCGPTKTYNIAFKYRWERPPGNVIGTEPEFLLKNIDFKDGGIYTCIVTHNLDSEKKEISVSTEIVIKRRENEPTRPIIPQSSPLIKFSNMYEDVLNLKETEYLYVTCEAINWKKSDYTAQWFFNQKYINGANNVLFKTPLDSNIDSGYYTCRIIHNDFPGQQYDKQLLVNIKKPEIVIRTLPEENLNIGGRIYRKCEILKSQLSSNEPLQYSWLKDNNIEVSKTNILDINIVDASVNGDYSCVIKSLKLNKSYMKDLPIRIGFILPAEYSIKIIKTPINPQLNKVFQMKCEVVPSLPNIVYRWKKDDVIIGSKQTFLISSFQESDFGSYSCEAFDSAGEKLVTNSESSSMAILKFQNQVDNINGNIRQITSHLGEKREMHCEIPPTSSSQGSDVRWYFNNRLLSSNDISLYNLHKNDRTLTSILTLIKVTDINEGQYRCEFDNKVDKINLKIIRMEPALTINPDKLIVYEGDPIEFHCSGYNILDFSNTQIRWSFRNRHVDNDMQIYNNRESEIVNSPKMHETSFLAMSKIKYQDDGFYSCTSQNGLKRTAELIVKKRDDSIILTITPEVIKVREGQQVIVECFSISQRTGEAFGNPRFTMQDGRNIAEDPRMTEKIVGKSRIRLSIKNGLKINDNNLKLECHAGIEMKSTIIYLENQCPPNYRRCNNGDCQPSGKFCNGVPDCLDGSDENKSVCNKCDPLIAKCAFFRNKLPLKNTFLVHWKCDGENDCGNNFDEGKCSEEDFKCGNLKFNCSNGKIIPRSYQCDKESDCPNGEDEIGCILPQVLTSPGNKIKRVRKGGSIELKCESHGVPRPFIVWRYNWGCLKDEGRMKVLKTVENCNKIISILRITNFQPGDDGIYNCESLSGDNRSFSEDYQLILETI